MRSMLMRECAEAAPGLIIGVDYGAGVRQMVELLEPFQVKSFDPHPHWKAKVWRSGREIGRQYDGAIIKIAPTQRILLPGNQP